MEFLGNSVKISGGMSFAKVTKTGDGTTLVDWTKGNFCQLDLGSSAETVTFTNPASTQAGYFTLVIKQSSSQVNVTLPTHTRIGTVPTYTDGADGKYMVETFLWTGSVYLAMASPWQE